jgi:hypothetical protein
MTRSSLENLHFVPPADFVHEEIVSSWRAPVAPGLSDPKLMQPQAVVRPNLTVTRVQVETPDLAAIAARAADELLERIKGIQGLRTTELQFSDGVKGVLLEYAFPVMQFTVVQLQAMRIDGDTLTTLVLCTESSRLTDSVHAQYVASLKSAAVKG